MEAKLTLKLDDSIIEQAKKYAKENNISLSKLIESYLHAITTKKRKSVKISPLVQSLTGVVSISENDKKDYTDFLTKKYS